MDGIDTETLRSIVVTNLIVIAAGLGVLAFALAPISGTGGIRLVRLVRNFSGIWFGIAGLCLTYCCFADGGFSARALIEHSDLFASFVLLQVSRLAFTMAEKRDAKNADTTAE